MLGSEGLQYSARLTVFPLGLLASIIEMHLTCFFLKLILVRGQLLGVLLSVRSKARALLFLYFVYSRIGACNCLPVLLSASHLAEEVLGLQMHNTTSDFFMWVLGIEAFS